MVWPTVVAAVLGLLFGHIFRVFLIRTFGLGRPFVLSCMNAGPRPPFICDNGFDGATKVSVEVTELKEEDEELEDIDEGGLARCALFRNIRSALVSSS